MFGVEINAFRGHADRRLRYLFPRHRPKLSEKQVESGNHRWYCDGSGTVVIRLLIYCDEPFAECNWCAGIEVDGENPRFVLLRGLLRGARLVNHGTAAVTAETN